MASLFLLLASLGTIRLRHSKKLSLSRLNCNKRDGRTNFESEAKKEPKEYVMITCLFSCEACGLVDCRVKVRACEEHESVKDWFEGTLLRAIAGHHAIMSPLCRSKEMRSLKIPLEEREDWWIGRQTDRIPPLEGHEPTDMRIPITPSDAGK
jgi:hypothetical protein